MPIDWGLPLAAGIVFYIVAISYKKKTGKPISELWKNREKKVLENIQDSYRKVYITKGIKQ